MSQEPKHNYTYNYYSSQQNRAPQNKKPARPKNKRRRTYLTLLAVLIVIIALAIFIFSPSTKTQKTITHDISKVVSLPKKVISPSQPSDGVTDAAIASMGLNINNIISANSDIEMSVSLIDLNSGQTEHYGEESAFTAASTTKVITAADFLNEVQNGKQTLSESIDGNTAQYELEQMIVISDDDAWNDLRNLLTYPQLQSYADSVGATSYQAHPNTVTSDNMAHIMDLLYKGQLLDPANTQLLMGYLKEANYRQYIVPAVPSSDTIYHKVGFYEDNVDDEAIITDGDKAFVIVIFTDGDGTFNWPERAVIMQNITKVALNTYFSQT